MLTQRILFVVLIATLALAACSPARATSAPPKEEVVYYGESDGGAGYAPDAERPAAEPVPQGQGSGNQGTDAQAPGADRVVIKTANLSLVVSDPVEASDRIAALAGSLNGFVVSSYTYQASVDADGNKIMQANITVRVPSQHLDSVLTQIKSMAVEVKTATVSGQDVTAEFTDLQSRLRNLEAAEAQLQSIMERATKTEDVLSVFNQLTYIREQIEQVKGQIEYYSQSAALSAITVELIPDVLSQPITVGGWRPEGVAKEALEALVRAMQGLATVAIWFVIYALPLGLVFGLPLYLIARVVARRLRAPGAA